MKRPRMVPYVDIVIPASRKRRYVSSSPSTSQPKTEPLGPNLCPRKKVKDGSETLHEGDNLSRTDLVKKPRLSPTVSDFNVGHDENPMPISPTVSDFNIQDEEDDVTHTHASHAKTSNLDFSLDISKHNAGSRGTIFYEPANDEVQEDGNLVVEGETPRGDLDSCSDDEIDDVPVRVLDSFDIYDLETHQLIHVGELDELCFLPRSYGASGIVTPWAEDIDEADTSSSMSKNQSSEDQRVKLSKILELNIHNYDDETRTFDGKIYIRTHFAWYILNTPSDTYKPFFRLFWLQHRMLHLVVTAALETPRITYNEFVDSLSDPDKNDEDDFSPLRTLGRSLSREDLEAEEVNIYIISRLPELCTENRIRINRVPLIKSILGSEEISLLDYDSSTTGRTSKSKAGTKGSTRRSGTSNPAAITVTPIVSGIASNLFKGLEVVGSSEFDAVEKHVAAEMKGKVKEHHDDPKTIVWGDPAPTADDFYSSVFVDGVKYEVGDYVMVNPGEDVDAVRAQNAKSEASKSANSYANLSWFACICYFFEETDKKGRKQKMFHGQWFVHGSKTILQETAHSKALYSTNDCDDIPIASIFRECKITMLGDRIVKEPPDGRERDSNDFHCSLACENGVDFIHLPSTTEIETIFASLPQHMPCYACGVKQKKAENESLRPLPEDGYTQWGFNYHRYDFVYVRHRKVSSPSITLPKDVSPLPLFYIAQIVKIKSYSDVVVRYFERSDLHNIISSKVSRGQLPSDERRLYRTNTRASFSIEDFDGVCHVQRLTSHEDIEEWIQDNDHFYTNEEIDEDGQLSPLPKNDLHSCHICHERRVQDLHRAEKLRQQNAPLRGLELFSGAGGLGTGMNMSGFVETKYAVEYIASAANTYRNNHPDTTVYCQDTCLLLKHAIEMHEGKKPKPLLSNDGKTLCPPMPRKGDIDFIYGGPPCQSFSIANHSPKPDDPRSSLPGNMLSYLEFYEADYFLLENVRGMLNFRLMSKLSQCGRSLEGGIKSGVVKFILRTLIALGYQVRFRVVQAGQYGAPQGRSRVIIWGAKRGLPLPEHPVPVYAFIKPPGAWNLPTGERLDPVSRSKDPNDEHHFAPLPPISVNNAIGDLPPFDWINPHAIIRATPEDKAEAKRRFKELGIAQCIATSESRDNGMDIPGFLGGASYATPPQNRYQKWLRQGMTGEDGEEMEVQGHYTKKFSARVVEATATVPIEPNADHRRLPLLLQPNNARPGMKAEKNGFYSRLDSDSHFKCALTVVAPNAKKSWVLHPSQKRIVSVRECARAQGFPDHYNFESEPDKFVGAQTRQIGNAVPVPLALALGKELGAALLKKWEEKEREGSPEV